jgi:3-deoxy-D-manno-octulosonic-acid transferase
MMHGVYTAALAGAMALYAPVAVGRKLTRGVPVNFCARLGYSPPTGRAALAGWIHAVSVGEAITAMPLVLGLRAAHPGLPLVVTTVTETGARVVRERLGAVAEHRYFPLDLPGAIERVVEGIRPAFLVCMETELWPNLVRSLHRRGVSVMMANGRLSDRSFRRYRLVRRLLRPTLERIRIFAMQSDEDARRIVALGAPAERVVVTGNMKHDAAAVDGQAAGEWRRRLGVGPDRPLWIAGSTHPGEEAAILEAHGAARERHPELTLIVAPRHPERADEVAALAARRWPVVLRSQLAGALAGDAVVVLDTVGELAGLYAAADVVFVGGSLVPHGGHNVIEPARLGKPVLFGPHVQNFREATALLLDGGGALLLRDAADLAERLAALLADMPARARMGAAARLAVAGREGAVRRTLDLVGRLQWPRPGPAEAGPWASGAGG